MLVVNAELAQMIPPCRCVMTPSSSFTLYGFGLKLLASSVCVLHIKDLCTCLHPVLAIIQAKFCT